MSDTPETAICIPCGQRHGRFNSMSDSIGTFWIGVCAWCGQKKSVTSPADYGFPKLPEVQHGK